MDAEHLIDSLIYNCSDEISEAEKQIAVDTKTKTRYYDINGLCISAKTTGFVDNLGKTKDFLAAVKSGRKDLKNIKLL